MVTISVVGILIYALHQARGCIVILASGLIAPYEEEEGMVEFTAQDLGELLIDIVSYNANTNALNITQTLEDRKVPRCRI